MTEDDVKARFEKENIEIFFMTLFPASFEKDALSCISQEVKRLTQLLSPTLKVSFDEDILLQEKLREYSQCTPCTKKTLLIRCKDHLGTYYLPAMLASEPIRKSYNLEQFDQYKALMLSVAIKLIFMGSTQGLIKRACDEIRLYAEGKRENLTPYLPRLNKVGNRYLQSLISDFETAREDLPNSDLSKKLTKAIDAQLAHYHTPLSNCAEGKQGIEKSGGTREFTSKHAMVETIYEDAELEDENNIEVKVLASQKKATEKYQQEENIGNTKEFVVVTIKEASSEHTLSHYGAQALQAKAISDHIIQNKISASCSINQATEFEIQQLLAYCETHYYSAAEEQKPVVNCLILMLFLGNALPQIINTKFSIKNGNSSLTRKHVIPSQKQRPEVALYLPHVSQHFDITFPSSLKNATLLRRVTKEDLSGALSTINKQHHTHLTLNKISGFLSHFHKQVGIDPVLTQLISDPDVQKLPALSYTHINIEDLIDTFDNFVRYIYNIAPTISISRPYISVKKKTKKQGAIDNKQIGSALYVSDEILSSLMNKLIERLNKSAANKSYWFTEDHHDLITSYSQMVLGLSSGYRPVTGWLGKKSDLNLFSGEYYISDKDSLAIGSGRVVIIPPITLKIIKQYLEFVSQAARYFKNIDPQLSKRYQKILNSREHLFFYRNTQDPDNLFDESTPSTIILQFDYFPLPPNWHRHQLRTLLHKHKVAPDLMDAWMGHTGISQTAFSQFSSIGIKDLRGISIFIENLLNRIGVKEVAYV
ncbi:hypothetical protein [Psychromonas sp. MME2]|uniref:hypothetical protein n=1 Tax=unclassified Psychromonas TaxID=2614957 RepID=UPI00339CF09E